MSDLLLRTVEYRNRAQVDILNLLAFRLKISRDELVRQLLSKSLIKLDDINVLMSSRQELLEILEIDLE